MSKELSEHNQFALPDDDAVLWRYIDFPRFVSMLSSNALFFTRGDLLATIDEFEGVLTLREAFARLSREEVHGPGTAELEAQYEKAALRRSAINSWHCAEHESRAMWLLYANRGLAIRSTFRRLNDEIETKEHVRFGLIEYLDYDAVGASGTGLDDVARLFRKRKSFEYEREFRALVHRQPAEGPIEGPGLQISANLDTLVDSIVMAPGSESWITEAAADTLLRFGFTWTVIESELDLPPPADRVEIVDRSSDESS